MSRNLGALTLLDPYGPAWPVMGVLYLYLYLLIRCFLMKLDTKPMPVGILHHHLCIYYVAIKI
jgi:hypothetical protein